VLKFEIDIKKQATQCKIRKRSHVVMARLEPSTPIPNFLTALFSPYFPFLILNSFNAKQNMNTLGR
jgi:hypothetical protein